MHAFCRETKLGHLAGPAQVPFYPDPWNPTQLASEGQVRVRSGVFNPRTLKNIYCGTFKFRFQLWDLRTKPWKRPKTAAYLRESLTTLG